MTKTLELQNILWKMVQLKNEMNEAHEQDHAQFQESITLAQDTTKRLITHFSEFERILNKIPQEIAPFFVKVTEKAAKDMADSAAQGFQKTIEEKSLARFRDTVQEIEKSLKTVDRVQMHRHFLVSIAFCSGVLLACIALFLLLNHPLKEKTLCYKEGTLSRKSLSYLNSAPQKQGSQTLGLHLFRKNQGSRNP